LEISGVIQSIIYRNEDNGYSVLDVLSGGKSVTVVGIFAFVNEGEYFTLQAILPIISIMGASLRRRGYPPNCPRARKLWRGIFPPAP